MRTLILTASLTGSVGFLSPAYGEVFPASYLIDLNTKEWTRLETLGNSTYAEAINDSGRVVGRFGWTSQPCEPGSCIAGTAGFITGPNGAGITALGMSDSRDINNAGQVAEYSEEPPDEGFLVSLAYITGECKNS